MDRQIEKGAHPKAQPEAQGQAEDRAPTFAAPPAAEGAHREEERVARQGDPRIEDDLDVAAQELKRRREREAGQREPGPTAREPVEEKDQKGQVRGGHDLAPVAKRAHGDQVRGERQRHAAQQRSRGGRAEGAQQRDHGQPEQEVVGQEPG